LLVAVRRHESDRQTLGTEPPGTAGKDVRKRMAGLFRSSNSPNAMQVRVRIRGSIIVDDDVYSLDIDTTTEDIGGNKDTFFESLERGITSDTK
jgi:hypothetical protein